MQVVGTMALEKSILSERGRMPDGLQFIFTMMNNIVVEPNARKH